MSGNTFGKIFKITTFGESHGKSLGVIIDGCPSNLSIDESYIQKFLDKRKPGKTKYTSPRKEADLVEIQSGVFKGKTTGTPIALLIKNKDQRSYDYEKIKDVYRPSHGDFVYDQKYKIRDYRGGGRASARETAARVAAGAVAYKYLQEQLNLKIYSFVTQIGDLEIPFKSYLDLKKSEFFCPNQEYEAKIADYLDDIKKQKDSVGAIVKSVCINVPTSLGEPVFDKLDADIAKALMSINAVKALSIGDGFSVASQKGSNSRDAMKKSGFLTNHAGGILAGISTGQEIITQIAIKPTSSIPHSIDTIDKELNNTKISVKGRHDPCIGIRACPIASSMLALVVIDHYLLQKAKEVD